MKLSQLSMPMAGAILLAMLAAQVSAQFPPKEPAKGAKTPPPAAPKLAPPPDKEAIDAATAIVRDLFKKDIEAAKTPALRSDLAKMLLKQANDSKSEPAGYFVLLEEARVQAVKAGDLITAFAAIDQLASAFKVAELERKRDALTALSTTSPPPMQKQLAELALSLVEDAVEIDDYPIAKEFATLGASSARKSKDPAITKAATARATEVEKLGKEYATVKDALTKLEKEPTDPQANLTAGKFYCFSKGNWTLGISMLALCADTSLKNQAEKDLAQPTEAAAQLALADGWWDLAEKLDGVAKTQVQLRACEWYRQAVPNSSGLAKAKAEKRLADLSAELTKAGSKSATVPSLPLLAKAQTAVKNAKTNKIGAHGFGLADTWEDLPEQGGLLVGLDVALTQNGEGILAIQGVYSTQRGEVRGRAYGKAEQGAQPLRIKAKNGYAIGAMQIRAGLFLDAIGVTFMQIQGDRLNPEMNYSTEIFGAKQGGGEKTLSLSGEPIIGLHGHIAKDGRLHSLGVITTPAGQP